MGNPAKLAKQWIARERVVVPFGAGGAVHACLVYPNSYALGMSNLGFQAVLGIFRDFPGVSCERAFLPYAAGSGSCFAIRSLESGRALADFDLVAFSLSFEADYLNVLKIFEGAGIEPLSRERSDRAPVVIAGGPATFINPEPIAEFFDLLLLGEAEEMLPEFLAGFTRLRRKGAGRFRLLEALSEVPGVYCPQRYEIAAGCGNGLGVAKPLSGASPRVRRRYVEDLSRYPTFSRILPAESPFGDMFLVEASRGCKWGCRFCAAGFVYRPTRYVGAAVLEELVDRGLEHCPTIGLVGAELGSLPALVPLMERAAQRDGRVSPSSLRADTVSEALARGLKRGLTRTVTVAPEAGSERLRRVINKNLSEDAILEAASRLAHGGVKTLRLYFMIGLPTESDPDVAEILALTRKVARRFLPLAPGSRIHLSISPFVPKPWTPFQWEGLEDVRSLKRKLALLRREAARMTGVAVEASSPREAYWHALLSRGDRRIASLLLAVHRAGGRWWPLVQEIRKRRGPHENLDLDWVVHAALSFTDPLPWEIVDQGVNREFLWRERLKAREEACSRSPHLRRLSAGSG